MTGEGNDTMGLTLAMPGVSHCRFTGGHSGVEWGTDGEWVEPYDDAGARETKDKLHRFWHGQQLANELPDGDAGR